MKAWTAAAGKMNSMKYHFRRVVILLFVSIIFAAVLATDPCISLSLVNFVAPLRFAKVRGKVIYILRIHYCNVLFTL